MAEKYKFSDEEVRAIEQALEKYKNTGAERRLLALKLYADGKTWKQIAQETGYSPSYIHTVVYRYQQDGLEVTIGSYREGYHSKSTRRYMGYEEEEEFLKPFRERAEKGEAATGAEIVAAYEKAIGHSISNSMIYRLFERHGWVKVNCQGRFPQSAADSTSQGPNCVWVPHKEGMPTKRKVNRPPTTAQKKEGAKLAISLLNCTLGMEDIPLEIHDRIAIVLFLIDWQKGEDFEGAMRDARDYLSRGN